MPRPPAAAQVRETARAWAAAIVSNDPARIAAHMADDWIIVSDTGPTTREQFLALITSGRLTHSAMDTVTDPRVRVHGDTAVLTARVTNTAHYEGETHPADEWTTDVFVRGDDGDWRCVLSHITAAAPQ
ncbi:nuclear transport factor 2 family protein [Streptomyces sp. ODS05-4]|uniref:nuclear transport factor 2 family protein n=1 Tax=Streptomyces sp. ODS05-4 TaxID=2944939 RepID=UPI002108B984|nr:nuclear transport factor 2 family protein [Streptomyces sp. ODS05-4]